MAFQQDLLDLNDLVNFSDLSAFNHNIPIDWVESALRLSSSATILRLRLPGWFSEWQFFVMSPSMKWQKDSIFALRG